MDLADQPGDEVLVPDPAAARASRSSFARVVGGGGRFGAIHSQMPVSWLMGDSRPEDRGCRRRPPTRRVGSRRPPRLEPGRSSSSTSGWSLAWRGGRRACPARPRARCVPRVASDVTLGERDDPLHHCLAAAEQLAAARRRGRGGRPAHDPSGRPGDGARLGGRKTNRIAVVEVGPANRRLGRRGLSRSSPSTAWGDLDDAWRIATPDSPIPYSPPLEDAHPPRPQAHRRRGALAGVSRRAGVAGGLGLGVGAGFNISTVGPAADTLAREYGVRLGVIGFLTTALFRDPSGRTAAGLARPHRPARCPPDRAARPGRSWSPAMPLP